MTSRSLTWDAPMSVKVKTGYRRFLQLLHAELYKVAKLMEAFAKAKHPWKNRTGDAERKFTVRVVGELTIEAAHGVRYGKYLEYRWGGRWGVIPATIREGNRLVMRAAGVAWVGAWGFQ